MSVERNQAARNFWGALAVRLDRLSRMRRVVLSLLVTLDLVILSSVLVDRLLIDSVVAGDVGRSVLKERRALSEEGLVVVNLAFDEETGIVVYGPEIESRGFIFGGETGHLLQDAQCVILEIIEEIDPSVPDRINLIRSKLRTALRQYFYFTIGRRPVIMPFIMEI